MADEFITPENVSNRLLKSVLDAAYIDSELNNAGNILVKEDIVCLITPSSDTRRIQLLTYFTFRTEISHTRRLECVNEINRHFFVINAFVDTNDTIFFSYDICLDGGGITKKSFVMQLKRFCSIPRVALFEYAQGLVI